MFRNTSILQWKFHVFNRNITYQITRRFVNELFKKYICYFMFFFKIKLVSIIVTKYKSVQEDLSLTILFSVNALLNIQPISKYYHRRYFNKFSLRNRSFSAHTYTHICIYSKFDISLYMYPPDLNNFYLHTSVYCGQYC